MATGTSNSPFVGGLTFLGSTAFQIALGLVVSGVSGADLTRWVAHHPYSSLSALLLISTALTSAMLWYLSRKEQTATSDAEVDQAVMGLRTSLHEQVEQELQTRWLSTPR